MSLFFATLGELIIIQLNVLFIWLRVLMDALRLREPTVGNRKLLTTSLGLVFNALGMVGVLSWRAIEYLIGQWPFVWGVTVFYAILAVGGIMFIITPALGGSLRSFKWFLAMTFLWSAFCTFSAYSGWFPS